MGLPSLDLASNVTKIPHPYYPLEVEIVGYLANEWSVLLLLSVFAAGCVAIFSATHAIAKRVQPRMPNSEVFTVVWLVLSGTIHLFFEGYFALNNSHMGSLQTLFGQLWKEYALSDSRYLTQDAFVLCMEAMTAAFWGPMCLTVATMIFTEHPLRHPLQAMVCLGQIYGLLLYYATSMFDHYVLDITYSRPEAWYFWGYYFMMNFFWIIFPGILLYNSVKASGEAFSIVQKLNKSKKST